MENRLEDAKIAAQRVRRNSRAEALMPLAAICVMAAAAYAYLLFHGWWIGLPMGGPENWGQFGDYFAGLTSPILGFFTLWLLLRTLQVTRQVRDDTAAMMDDQRKAFIEQKNDMDEQLALLQNDAERRTNIERIDTHRRILQGILAAWQAEMANGVYNGLVAIHGNAAFPSVQEKTFGALLYDPRTAAALKADFNHNEEIRNRHELMIENWRNRFAEPIRLVHEMDVHARRFINAGGPEVEAESYRSRLAPAVGVFRGVGLVALDITHRFGIN